jgi:hypothetical protein
MANHHQMGENNRKAKWRKDKRKTRRRRQRNLKSEKLIRRNIKWRQTGVKAAEDGVLSSKAK